MFTLNIRNIVAVGRGEVKWDIRMDNSPKEALSINADPVNRAKILLKDIRESNFSKGKELKELGDILKNLDKDNTTQKTELNSLLQAELDKETRPQSLDYTKYTREAYYSLPTEGDKKDIGALLTAWKNDFKIVEAKAEQLQSNPKQVISEKTQEKSSDLRGSVGLTAQSEALQKIFAGLSKEKGNESLISIIGGLKDVNIVSLLIVAKNLPSETNVKGLMYDSLKALGYTPDGAFGPTELKSAIAFLDAVQTNAVFKEKVMHIAQYAEAGLDPTVTIRGDKQVDVLDATKVFTIVEYFGDVPSGRFSKDLIMKTLTKFSNSPSFVANVSRIANLSGVTTTEGLVVAIRKNPAAKARFYDSLNTSAATGVIGIESFFDGKGAERAESLVKEFQNKAKQAREELDKVNNDSSATPDAKKKAQATVDALDKKGGTTWLTGEIQKVAQAAFVNVGKDANAAGFGLTYEAFVRGLTVTIGAGVGQGGQFMPAAVMHFGTDTKLGETDKSIVKGNIGAGVSVFPIVMPFIDGGISFTDKITTIGNGRGNVNTVGIQMQAMPAGGVLMLSAVNDRADEIAQGQTKLMGAIGDMAKLSGTNITSTDIGTIIEKTGLKSSQQYLEYWTQQVNELYRVNGVTKNTTPEAKIILLSGLVQSEVEKSHVQEAQNDKNSKSFIGGMVGVGHIFGVTFPVLGLLWKEGKMKYGPTKQIEYVTQSEKELKFSELYTISKDDKIWTFKDGEKPKNVNIPDSIGKYDANTGTIIFKNSEGNKVSSITTTSDGKLDTITLIRETPIVAAGVRDTASELPKEVQSGIYTMNRNDKYVSFNKAIDFISMGSYDQAYIELKNAPKSDTITKILGKLDLDGQLNAHTDRLAIILSYTYGAKGVKNKITNVSKGEYQSAHSQEVQNAERRKDPTRWNDTNEKIFATAKTHSTIPLSKLFPNQDLSVSVFATPSGGNHRIDKFQGSLSVSSVIAKTVNPDQMEALIKEHKFRIEKIVDELIVKLQAAGKDTSVITVDTYKELLRTGKLPSTWTTIGLKLDKLPVFFEARAMAAGNICMNKTEGIGYPTFSSLVDDKGKTHMITRITTTKEVDYVGGSVEYAVVTTGLIGTGVEGKKESDTQQNGFETNIETRDVQVSPRNIQVINDRQVIVVNSGGTQTNIPLSTLTRTQAMQLAQGQSITLTTQVNVQVPIQSTTIGVTINRAPDAVALAGTMLPTDVTNLLTQLLNDPKYKFAEEPKK